MSKQLNKTYLQLHQARMARKYAITTFINALERLGIELYPEDCDRLDILFQRHDIITRLMEMHTPKVKY